MGTLRSLGRRRCLELLASVPLGRVVFTDRALPAIRPVNHLLDGETIVIRSGLGHGLASAATAHGALVVAYEADQIDATARTGWSVVVTGSARLIMDEERIRYYESVLDPWIDEPMNCVIGIDCDLVSGFELAALSITGNPLNR
ncbi:pyridoxamine 5'-phosphate oxidase family protein [Dactylosporangium vinaceum]|uniref:Pyridoxamine 5'-phosphate oxidase family protein n=1 Tax=Dactylosporangium vinaceum TaxID=53362 RepID=A0ABV5MA66_9ACTN|nr:pyridoxamine 5'-phosphate oxidase family protein [Dactylosporangium vinaceum]